MQAAAVEVVLPLFRAMVDAAESIILKLHEARTCLAVDISKCLISRQICTREAPHDCDQKQTAYSFEGTSSVCLKCDLVCNRRAAGTATRRRGRTLAARCAPRAT